MQPRRPNSRERKLDDCRALGVVWKPTIGVFTYRLHVPPEVTTKRSAMSAVMSVFDPVGYLTGWLLRGKLFLQGLRKLELTWDKEIPATLRLTGKSGQMTYAESTKSSYPAISSIWDLLKK